MAEKECEEQHLGGDRLIGFSQRGCMYSLECFGSRGNRGQQGTLVPTVGWCCVDFCCASKMW